MSNQSKIDFLLKATRGRREQLVSHKIYSSLKTIEHVRVFMEHHVFAVWDFMSLVKSLQKALTSTTVPWSPSGNPTVRRLINEIVLDEESDEDGRGGYSSHFELYLEAMDQCGAQTGPIHAFLEHLKKTGNVREALLVAPVPQPSKTFVESTWQVIESKSIHRIASAFAIGREEIVPDLFKGVIATVQKSFPKQMDLFAYYLARHIEVDKDRHWPMSTQMLNELGGQDETKWAEMTETATDSLQARISFWDQVKKRISTPGLLESMRH